MENKKNDATKHTTGTKAKGGRKGKRKDKLVVAKLAQQMSRTEWWWLEQLWKGDLGAEMKRAEAKCHGLQAKDFVVNNDD